MQGKEDFNVIKRELVDRIGKMEEKSGGAWTELALLKAEITSFKERIDRHGTNQDKIYQEIREYHDRIDHIVIGNGKPGLVGDVFSLKEDLRERKDEVRQNGYIAKTAGIGLICKVFFDFFHHVK